MRDFAFRFIAVNCVCLDDKIIFFLPCSQKYIPTIEKTSFSPFKKNIHITLGFAVFVLRADDPIANPFYATAIQMIERLTPSQNKSLIYF